MPRAAPSSSSSATTTSDDGDDDGVDETLPRAMSDDAIDARGRAVVLRARRAAIDREDRRAFHRVHSIARDAAFVEAQGEAVFARVDVRGVRERARGERGTRGGGRARRTRRATLRAPTGTIITGRCRRRG